MNVTHQCWFFSRDLICESSASFHGHRKGSGQRSRQRRVEGPARDWRSNLGMELLLIMLMGISVYNGIYLLYNIMKHYVTMVVEPPISCDVTSIFP